MPEAAAPAGLRLRLRGRVMILGIGRSSRSSETLVAAWNAYTISTLPHQAYHCRKPQSSLTYKLTSIQSTTSLAPSVCNKNCSPSLRTLTTFLRFT